MRLSPTAVVTSSLDLIGNTPLVQLGSGEAGGARVLAKLEGANLAGSVKDRPARGMIEDAERTGALEPGMTILEASSGNTGIALAMIGAVKGYRVKIVAPDNVTSERYQLLTFYRAEIVPSDGLLGTKGSIEVAAELAASSAQYCWMNQYANPANPRAHYETTGPEILAAVPYVDALVAGIGSGGTLMGTGRRLRERDPDVSIVGIEPFPGGKLMGLRNVVDDAFIPDVLDLDMLDRRLVVSGAAALATVRRQARESGLFLGMSAGAVLWGALRVARGMDDGTTVVAVLADAGWKYLSTGMWRREGDDLEVEVDDLLDITW